MSALYDQLEKQVRLLPPEERARLALILIEELDARVDVNVEKLWLAEAERRFQAYLNGEIDSRQGDDVMVSARSRIK